RLARDLFVLADERQRLSLFIDERQKRLAEAEQALSDERQRAAELARQAENLNQLIVKLERGLDTASRAARAAARSSEDGRAARTCPRSRRRGGRARPPPLLRPRECCRCRSTAPESRNLAPRTASAVPKRAYRSPPALGAKSRPHAMDGWFTPAPSAIMANS